MYTCRIRHTRTLANSWVAVVVGKLFVKVISLIMQASEHLGKCPRCPLWWTTWSRSAFGDSVGLSVSIAGWGCRPHIVAKLHCSPRCFGNGLPRGFPWTAGQGLLKVVSPSQIPEFVHILVLRIRTSQTTLRRTSATQSSLGNGSAFPTVPSMVRPIGALVDLCTPHPDVWSSYSNRWWGRTVERGVPSLLVVVGHSWSRWWCASWGSCFVSRYFLGSSVCLASRASAAKAEDSEKCYKLLQKWFKMPPKWKKERNAHTLMKPPRLRCKALPHYNPPQLAWNILYPPLQWWWNRWLWRHMIVRHQKF